MYLILIFDLVILNACCITLTYAFLCEVDWLWGLLLVNNVGLVGLRHYVFRLLEIDWLKSPLNRSLKRSVDVLCSLIFLLTLFPIILFVYTLYHFLGKKYRDRPVIAFDTIGIGDGREFHTLVLVPKMHAEKDMFACTPIAFNILVGNISLWDLNMIRYTGQHLNKDIETPSVLDEDYLFPPDRNLQQEQTFFDN